jgi:hypothetical protein
MSRLEPLTSLITSDQSGVAGDMQGVAYPAYLSRFLFPGLLRVAPYCAPGGINITFVFALD